LDRLAAVVAEAEVHRGRGRDGVQHPVDGFQRPGPLVGRAGQVGLVHLDDGRAEVPDLLREHIRDGHGERRWIAIVGIERHLGQHVRTRQGELHWLRGQLPGPLAGGHQVERARAQWPFHHGRGSGPERHTGRLPEGEPLGQPDLAPDARHRTQEVLDYAVGLGVVDVEAVELAVAHHVDAGELLGADDHARGIHECLLAGRCDQPVGEWVRAHRRRQDAWRRRLAHR